MLKALHPQAYSTSNAPEIPGAVEMEEKDTRDNTRHIVLLYRPLGVRGLLPLA